MKRSKLVKHLFDNGCDIKREGSGHTIFVNMLTGKRTPVPRHSELDDILCNDICKQLGVPKIK
jgi:predicted RNA binding protein YcfA (HicA-like mRNA interferase family)